MALFDINQLQMPGYTTNLEGDGFYLRRDINIDVDIIREVPVPLLINFFFKREGMIYSNEFMEVNSRNVVQNVGFNKLEYSPHNLRPFEWTSDMHERRVAYVIRGEWYHKDPIEIELHEESLKFQELVLIDGYHRLIAADLMMKQTISVKFKDKYTADLALVFLQG